MKTMTNMSKYCFNTRFIKSMKAAGALFIHILREPSFLRMNKTGAPHGDTLGLINPLSRRFFNYFFNSLSSAGAILYSGIDMGYVSGRRSISKLIPLSKGTPERSSGNISGNSDATDTDSRVGVSELESWTRTRW
ncbi:hypothetical protein FXO38_33072 [Capsicum annuum]|uniref:Uncharacterized protein n=1 Tax=Capsicum annuum TaxID=4072 RepID=A0A2G2Y1A8_CAPAN|nr:hypothetical protein FXO38_33072 [Capsicum annuum]KAF3649890.1 hypothetical protein FXO37_18730 [Capsicum annuum]PHT63546.1 hypothetical protein T459_32642 [Capsicum annuum]